MRDWDWLRPNTLNLFEYCYNDPTNSWDPTGFAVYWSNRTLLELNGDPEDVEPTESSAEENLNATHSYITLTDEHPSGIEIITETLSFGNSSQSAWFQDDASDMSASNQAFMTGVAIDDEGNQTIEGATMEGQTLVAGEALEPFIRQAFAQLQANPEEYDIVSNNCKDGAKELIQEALRLARAAGVNVQRQDLQPANPEGTPNPMTEKIGNSL